MQDYQEKRWLVFIKSVWDNNDIDYKDTKIVLSKTVKK